MKKMSLMLIPLLLLVACQNNPGKTATYSAKNFSFEYSKDWKASEDGFNGSKAVSVHSLDQNQLPSFDLNPPLPKDGDFGMGIDNYKNDKYTSKQNVQWDLTYFKDDANFYKEIKEAPREKWRMVMITSPYLKDVFDGINTYGMVEYEFEEGVDLEAEAQLKAILDSFKKI